MSRDGDEPERAPASRTPEGEAPGPGTRPRSRQVARGAAGGNDDFLYHLYRGSSMLLQDQVVEAKEELERALALQPQDAKSQDLLAGVYFRLGVYPRAIEIWRRLVDAYPKEPTLRVNLALALFKTGQADDALEHVHEALRIQPDHERAWGYLGLIHWRLGQLEAARDAFLRGGQASMARRMEEALGRDAPMPDPGPSGEELEASDRAAMRSAAEEALERLDSESPRLALEGQAGRAEGRPSGVWSPIEPGTEVVPPRPAETRPRLLGEPPTLADRVRRWTVALSPDTPLAVTASGALLVQAEHDVFLRLSNVSAVRGELRTTVVRRRTRGRELDALLGGKEPVMHWRGPITALVRPPRSRLFAALRLGEDALYVREELLFGFDDRVGFETANLPLAGDPVVVTQLHGDGIAVLTVPAEPVAMRVQEGEELRVDPAQLIGWSGRLFPNAQRGTAPYSAHAPPLGFRGDGVVLLGEAADLR